MDNHPIPQDVTGFQFRLIGNMTVKQFGFLAAGVVLSVIIYYMPVFLLFKVFFIPLISLMGFALAFIPIEGRPMDAMLGYYLKALFSPNQFVFHKSLGHFSFDRTFQNSSPLPIALPVAVQKTTQAKASTASRRKQLNTMLHQVHSGVMSKTDSHEEAFLTNVMSSISSSTITTPSVTLPTPAFTTQAPQHNPERTTQDMTPNIALTSQPVLVTRPLSTPPPSISTPSTSFIPSRDDADGEKRAAQKEQQLLAEKEQELEKEELRIQQLKDTEEKHLAEERLKLAASEDDAKKIAQDNQLTHTKLLELEKSLQDMLSQKQTLEQELQSLKSQLSEKTPTKTFTPSTASNEPKQQTQLVRQIPQDQTHKKGLPPTPDSPNILLGLVKDSSDNILPNILIEVKDKEGNPVRAFKTNQLGQFASATPLANGIYTIEFEDTNGKNKFDAIELEAKGEILYPIEVISHDLRAELRKQLFT